MTAEQRVALAAFRSVIGPLGLRVRADAEGWPMVLAAYGRIEWFCNGVDCWSCRLPGEFALAVHTDRPRLFARVWAIPGVVPHQIGACELRAVFLPSALPEVARLIRAQRQRPRMSSEQARSLGASTAFKTSSRPEKGAGAPAATDRSPVQLPARGRVNRASHAAPTAW